MNSSFSSRIRNSKPLKALATYLIVALVAGAFSPAVTGCSGGAGGAAPNLSASQKGTIYYVDDHLGSAQIVAYAESGEIYEEVIYPYGLGAESGEGGDAGADYSYTTKERDDETGLVYFGARYYAPEIGRWITPDPLFTEDPSAVASRPFEGNLYSYVRGNPSTYVDPDGELPIFAIIVAAIIGAMALVDPGIANAPAPGQPALPSPSPTDHATNVSNVATMLLPGVNDIRDGIELVTGRDHFTGASIGLSGRVYAGLGLAIGSGAAYRSLASSDGIIRLGLGLGPSEGRMGYKVWSQQRGFSTWADLSGKGSFNRQIDEAMTKANEIHFNLHGVDVRRANTLLNDYGEPLTRYTDFELGLIKERYMDKVVWWDGDVKMPESFNPFE